MKKIFITVFTAFLFLGVNVGFVNANGLNDNIINVFPDLSDYPYSSVLNNQEALFFNSKEDYETYLQSNDQSNDYQTFNTGGYITKPEIISSVYKPKLWIGYHSGTPEWRKASSHSLSTGKNYSVSGSYQYKGFNLSTGFSYSNSVSSTFPADSKRYSRLGVRGDYTFEHIKSTEYRYGQPTGRVSYYAKAKLHNRYIMTVYQ